MKNKLSKLSDDLKDILENYGVISIETYSLPVYEKIYNKDRLIAKPLLYTDYIATVVFERREYNKKPLDLCARDST